MNATLELDVEHPAVAGAAVSPSLQGSGPVEFTVEAGETVDIAVASDRLGSLRGAVNTALMLTRLSDKVAARGDT